MPEDIFDQLCAVIADRKNNAGSEKSYVAHLMNGGVEKIGGKIREEAEELIEAAAEEDDDHTIYEAADLLFHTFVMLGHLDLPLDRVRAELARRFGMSGIAEKESRKNKDT